MRAVADAIGLHAEGRGHHKDGRLGQDDRQDAVDNASPELRRRLDAGRAELEQVEAEARSTWDELPADWQQAIRRIHEHHGDAVAEVSDGLCGACHVAVTSSGRQALRRGALLTCDNCGRILVLA